MSFFSRYLCLFFGGLLADLFIHVWLHRVLHVSFGTQWQGLETALMKQKLSTRTALPVAGPQTAPFECKVSTRNALRVVGLVKVLFWSTNSARGTLFQWQGLETALLEYKLSTRNTHPVAGLGYCSFGVQTQYAEGSSSGLSSKLLFWSTNSARGTLFQWQGLETARLLEYKLSTRNTHPVAGLGNGSFGVQTQYAEGSSSGRASNEGRV